MHIRRIRLAVKSLSPVWVLLKWDSHCFSKSNNALRSEIMLADSNNALRSEVMVAGSNNVLRSDIMLVNYHDVCHAMFVQFHPTALADGGLPIKPKKPRENAFLITEAVRGDGGILYNQAMERFMPLYDERAELAPRDVVARSIDDQLKKRKEKYVLLDISHKQRADVLSHFPNIAAECRHYGLDITREPIPVVPAAHYMCGGVRAGLHGETNVKSLYVAGEVACTGLHGANRLASNSLLEALVFAQRAVQPSVELAKQTFLDHGLSNTWAWPVLPMSLDSSVLDDLIKRTRETRELMQMIMWQFVGIVRSTSRLKMAEWRLRELEYEWEDYLFQHGWEPTMVGLEACEMRNLFCCANLLVSSALARHESRGLHFTLDFPHVEESKRQPTIIFPSSPAKITWSSQQVQRQYHGGRLQEAPFKR
ncbi:L-aspartate oxidase 2-a, chloroplastic [Asimina triloba]